MKKISRALLGAALLAVSGFAAAATTTVTVDAVADFLGGYEGSAAGSGLDTGFSLAAGQAFTVTSPTTDRWTNGPDASWLTDADGHDSQIYTIRGLTDSIGSLVGEIGDSNVFFNIGTNFAGVANFSGDLKLFFFDTDTAGNAGTVGATISAVPEPTNLALMGLALGAFALTRRRKA